MLDMVDDGDNDGADGGRGHHNHRGVHSRGLSTLLEDGMDDSTIGSEGSASRQLEAEGSALTVDSCMRQAGWRGPDATGTGGASGFDAAGGSVLSTSQSQAPSLTSSMGQEAHQQRVQEYLDMIDNKPRNEVSSSQEAVSTAGGGAEVEGGGSTTGKNFGDDSGDMSLAEAARVLAGFASVLPAVPVPPSEDEDGDGDQREGWGGQGRSGDGCGAAWRG